jgi:type I restriction enzyme, R subunit
MSFLNPPERDTQNKVIALFSQELGYTYYGNLEQREDNSNLHEDELRRFLHTQGHAEGYVNGAIEKLRSATRSAGNLYEVNKHVYMLLRYGATVSLSHDDRSPTIPLIDWEQPQNNRFGIAEEVTLKGENTRRPDVVLYINGIAIGVLELKRATVPVIEAIGQCRSAQQDRFVSSFFTTVQLVLAGNASEGLRYGTTGTEAKYFLRWKEDGAATGVNRFALFDELAQLCQPRRLLELLNHFVLFDAGVKKLPRPHQFFGVNAALTRIAQGTGGVIWHTQGSGKSLTMVLMARRLLETDAHNRIVVVTDREELDKQIKDVFTDAGKDVQRATSGRDLMQLLELPQHRIISTLVHKFGRRGVDDLEELIKQLRQHPPQVSGRIIVFVDECHRTQSGRLHKLMKAVLPDALFIGFTGTPLLKTDKQTSLEVFGSYIHTYKFNEAVRDGVVLDLQYEARDIAQELSSPNRVDNWFEAKTQGLNPFGKAKLKQQWATMQKVLSSKSRMEKIVADITTDFGTRPRLSNGGGNAILVAGSIYEACKYYTLLNNRESPFKNKCGIVTSYNPSKRDVVTGDMENNTETEREYIFNTYTELLNGLSTEAYETAVKKKFTDEPAQMQLIIVVDKLLTGFDAPPCTFLYIDKHMQDHGLFQAICRVNRLHGDDKQFGYIVDYKGLFRKMERAVGVYTSELDYDKFTPEDCDILIDERRKRSRELLEKELDALARHCEPVPVPRGTFEYMRWFCGDMDNAQEQETKTPLRHLFYRLVRALVNAHANLADGYVSAGYTREEYEQIGRRCDDYVALTLVLRNSAGENFDGRMYEADMRYMIDIYLNARDPRLLMAFQDDVTLLDLIAASGIDKVLADELKAMRAQPEVITEMVVQNIRLKISRDEMQNPAFFERMSQRLNQILEQQRQESITYEKILKELEKLVKEMHNGSQQQYPPAINTQDLRTLYNNLNHNEKLALDIHHMVLNVRADNWRNHDFNKRELEEGLYHILQNETETDRIFALLVNDTDY